MKNTLLCFLLLLGLCLSSQPAQEYFFNNSFSGTAGAPTLNELVSCGAVPGAFGTDSIITTSGLCSVSTAFCFNAGGGLAYPNSSITSSYSINLFFKFNTLGGWSRIIDFSNSGADAGIYLLNNCLNFYPNGNVGSCPYFLPNIFYLFTFVRDGATNIISVYVNGTLFGTYTDVGNIYRPANITVPINFFRDDTIVHCEDKAGCIKYASVSPNLLSASQVDSIWLNICNISLPPCNAFISYPGSPYSDTTATPQSVTRTGTAGGKFTSTTGLTIDSLTGAITPVTSTPGTYRVIYTVSDSSVCGIFSDTAYLTIAPAVSINCSPSGNMLIFTNYDGGILNINVDVNIPNLKIGVVTYENCSINITGPYAGNVSKVVYAGYQGTNNNCNLPVPIAATNINGVPPSNYTINQYPPAALSNPNGYPSIICAYSCDVSTNQGGCNTIDQVVNYFNTQLGGTIYSLNVQYCCWRSSATYHVSALSNRCCISSSPTASINYTGTPYCTSVAAAQAVSLTGTTGGTYTSSPSGLAIDAVTGTITPNSSQAGTYTITYTIPGCPAFTTTATVMVTASPTATISYSGTAFCIGSPPQQVTLTGTAGGTYKANSGGLTIDTVTGAIIPGTSAPGNYTVTYTPPASGACAAVPATSAVIISSVLATSVSANICNGGSYTFGSQTLNTTGTYRDTLTTLSGCDSIVTLSLNFYTPPSVTLHANDSIFCPGDSTQICTTTTFASYLWNGGAVTQCIFAKNAGNYYVTVTDANNCTVQSPRLNLTLYPSPPVSISISGDTLSALSATAYQWYLNDTVIAGAHGAMFIALSSGLYKVQITDTNGCKTTSTAFPVTVTGIKEIVGEEFEVYPNPVQNGSLHVKTGADFIGSELDIFNAAGQIIFKSEVRSQQFELNLVAAPGIYNIRVSSKNNTVIRKLIHL